MSLLVSALFCLVLAGPRIGMDQNPSDTAPPSQPVQAVPQAQSEGPDALKPPTPAHTGFRALFVGLKDDLAHLPSRQNLYIGVTGGGVAVGTHAFDQTVNAGVLSQYDTLNRIFTPGQYVGGTPAQMAFSIGTWAIGRAMDKPKMSHLGMDLLRAQAVAEILVVPVKLATRRERPDGSNRQSFPSGHAAVTFATAAVIQRHLGWRRSFWAYGIASYVALSRLHDNRHYLSDVVFGAAVGSIAGRTVTEHGRETWSLSPVAVPGGVALVVTRTGS